MTSFIDKALAATDLVRLFATPFATNDASNRVLEKAGFVSEERLRKSVVKEDVIMDQLMYAKCV